VGRFGPEGLLVQPDMKPGPVTTTRMSKTPIRVCITGAAGQIGYALLPHICLGKTFGPDQPFILHLLDLNIDAVQTNLTGVKMELEDSTYPLLQGVVTTGDPSVAFNGADFVIMLGAFPRKDGMERKDLLVEHLSFN
jgi:malate/lactate dehydrogenase